MDGEFSSGFSANRVYLVSFLTDSLKVQSQSDAKTHLSAMQTVDSN